jgi:hypothetical protein
MRWRRRSSLILLLTLACDASTAPGGRILQGHWGSIDAELVAIYAGAELRFECVFAIIDHAVPVSSDSTFTARARLARRRRANLEILATIQLTGSIANGDVTISVPASSDNSAATYVLQPGVTRTPVVCPT